MQINYHLVAGPAVEPVTLALAKAQLNVEAAFTDDDALIGGLITAARQLCEQAMCRAIFNQSWLLTLDHFPWVSFNNGTVRQTNRSDWPFLSDFWQGMTINLPMPRLVSVTSITYVDLTGATQTLDPGSYYADVNSEPARIVPKPGAYWPYTQQYVPGSVQVTFVAGTYGDGVEVNTCPQTIALAIMQMVADWYANRENSVVSSGIGVAELPYGVRRLLESEKFYCFTLENN
jgi:uncharacterized phiE125 gp8 family phage protein